MIALLVACSVLSLASGPEDLYDEPMKLDIGAPPPCTADAECFVDTPLCDVSTGMCVACLGPEHCEEGWDCGPTGTCRDACEVDVDCDGIEGQTLCNPETGFCAQCLSSDDCPAEQYCIEDGWCRNDHCIPGETLCFGNTILLCLEDGGSTMEVEVCPEVCEVNDTNDMGAQCEAASDSGGGSGVADGTGSAGGSATGGSATGGGAEGSGGSPIDDDPGGKGCACQAAPSTGVAWAWAWLLVLGAGLGRRRW